MWKKKKRRTNLTDVDLDRTEGTLYLVREYKFEGPDRTVAVYTSKDSAERALEAINQNRQITKGKFFDIETFNYIEHKNSLVGK